jgi:hypothetical protein
MESAAGKPKNKATHRRGAGSAEGTERVPLLAAASRGSDGPGHAAAEDSHMNAQTGRLAADRWGLNTEL